MKKLLCLALALSMLMLTACAGKTIIPSDETTTAAEPETTVEAVQNTYTAKPETVKKSETVYVNMDNTGKVLKTVVSDWLHTDAAQVAVDDISNLTDIVNVKSSIKPVANGENLVWHMDTTDLYYSGTSSAELPVSIEIKYFLDGTEMKPEDIAGKSGEVKIQIKMTNNVFTTEKIDGAEVKIYNPIIVIGGMILQENQFIGTKLDGGKTIGDGSKEIAVVVGLPGINETLGFDSLNLSDSLDIKFNDTFTLTTQATDFSLGNMYFAALPLSSLSAEINLPETLGELKTSLNQLKDLENVISSIDPDKIIASLINDSDKINSLVTLIDDAIGLFESNKALLELIPKYLTDENMAAMTKLFDDLEDTDIKAAMELLSNPVIKLFLQNLPTLAEDMESLAPVMDSLSEDMKNPEVASAVENLPETLETLTNIQTAYEENKELITSLSSLLSAENLNKIDGLLDAAQNGELSDTLEEYGVLADNADSLITRLNSMLKFGNKYKIFTTATEDTETSVLFVFQTQSINKPVAQTEKTEKTSEQTDGFFKKLFTEISEQITEITDK